MQIEELVSPVYTKINGRTPAALYGFVKIKDMSHKEEVKLIMGIKDKVTELLRDIADTGEIDFDFDKPKRKAFSLDTLRSKLEPELRGNSFYNTSFSTRRFLENNDYTKFSIAGGFPRNELMGKTDVKTDIDLICQDEACSNDVLSMCFKQLPSENTVVKTYEIPDNTMHTIYYPFWISKPHYDDRGRRMSSETIHVFVDPLEFDFTMNCACISSTDGCLYAPPATLYDIENKILRPTIQLTEGYHISQLLKLPLLIRSIRFALKYDMEMHNDLYTAMKVYFKLQRERQSMDDKSMYHGLKHLLDDDKSLRDEFYSVFRKLDVFETEKFPTFDEYFQYITERKRAPRENKLIVGDGVGFHY